MIVVNKKRFNMPLLLLAVLISSIFFLIFPINKVDAATNTYTWKGTSIENVNQQDSYYGGGGSGLVTPPATITQYTNPNPQPVTIGGIKYIVFTNGSNTSDRIYIQPFDPNCILPSGADGKIQYCYNGIDSSDLHRSSNGDSLSVVNISGADAASTQLNSLFNLAGCPNGPNTDPQSDWSYNCIGGGAVINGEFTDTAGVTDSDTTELEQGCAAHIGPFGWILCEILDLFDGMYNFIQTRIKDILLIDPEIFNTNNASGQNLYESWSSVKNIANGLIALSALVIIASQIFGFEILSAYTVKKALPRVLIAAIAIQLSWVIFTSMILLVNALGQGMHDLLIWPFVKDGSNDITSLLSSTDGGSANALGLVATSALVGGAIALSGAWLTFVLALLGALVSLVIAFFVITVRTIVIIILLVLAPIALAAWVIPGTQTWWKIWWETFSKVLLMFPLIMALFAAGTIGANIIYDTTTDASTDFFQIIAMVVVYFAPLFLITTTYKFAGGLFGKIVNIGKKAEGDSRRFGWFGLREQAKADKDYVAARKKEDAFKTLADPSSGKFKRAMARKRTGTLAVGAMPKTYAAKKFGTRTELAVQQGIEQYDKELVELSQREFKNAFESVGYDRRKDFLIALHSADLDKDFDFDGKTYKASAYMKLGAAETTAGFKQTQFLDNSLNQIEAKDSPEEQRLLRRVMSAPTFDERMTDRTRGAIIWDGATRDSAGRVTSAVGVRGKSGNPDENVFNKMFQNYEKLDDDRKTVLREHIFNLNHSAGQFDIAASKLSRAAANTDLGEADLQKFAASMKGRIDLSDMLKVQQSKGSLQIQYDSLQDKYIAAPSAGLGTPTSSVSGGPSNP